MVRFGKNFGKATRFANGLDLGNEGKREIKDDSGF